MSPMGVREARKAAGFGKSGFSRHMLLSCASRVVLPDSGPCTMLHGCSEAYSKLIRAYTCQEFFDTGVNCNQADESVFEDKKLDS